MHPHPSNSGLPVAKTYDFANPESDGADIMWYATEVQGLSSTAPTAVSTLQIDQAVDFYWVATTLQADIEGALQTESTLVVPIVEVVVKDNSSQKSFGNLVIPVASIAGGTGERPYRLVEPRRLAANSTFSFSWTANVAAGTTYTHLYLVLHGYTLPAQGWLG